jgi:hypothetical protein
LPAPSGAVGELVEDLADLDPGVEDLPAVGGQEAGLSGPGWIIPTVEPSEKPGDPAWLERLPLGDREHVRAQLARVRARRPRRSASERAWRAKHGLAGGGIVSCPRTPSYVVPGTA